MIQYEEIEKFGKKMKIRDDLSGSFLASVFSHSIPDYTTEIIRLIMMGYIYHHDPELQKQIGTLFNSGFLIRDMKRIASQTNIILSAVLRRAPFPDTHNILKRCIEILFSIGYDFNGAELPTIWYGDNPSTIPTSDIVSANSSDLPEDIANFLNGLEGL